MKAFKVLLTCMVLASTAGQGLAYETKRNEATLDYIKEVLRMSRVLVRSGGVTTGHMALIFDRTAERIEDKDLSGVAEEVADWGFDVAGRLRNVSLMFRDIGMRASVAGPQFRTVTGWQYWGYYVAFWTRTYANNSARRVATYDAGRFKFEQYNEIRTSGAALRRAYQYPDRG